MHIERVLGRGLRLAAGVAAVVALAGCTSDGGHDDHAEHGAHEHVAPETTAADDHDHGAAEHHHAEGEQHEPRPAAPPTDLVCGMPVAADAPIAHEHGGITYRFCSQACKERFIADPEAVLNAACTCRDTMTGCDCGHCAGNPWYCPCHDE